MPINKTYVEADWSVGNVTAPIPLNWRGGVGSCQVVVTGTIDFDIELSNSDLQSGASGSWLADTNTAGLTASDWITFNAVPRFIRLKVNSFTTGATVTINLAQADV